MSTENNVQSFNQELANNPLLKEGRVYGRGESEPVNFGCFISAACQGTHDNIIDSLHIWRDEAIKNGHRAKTAFIKMYYKLWAKPGAQLLYRAPSLKPISRQLILLFIWINRIKLA